jgi:hypothetical protein
LIITFQLLSLESKKSWNKIVFKYLHGWVELWTKGLVDRPAEDKMNWRSKMKKWLWQWQVKGRRQQQFFKLILNLIRNALDTWSKFLSGKKLHSLKELLSSYAHKLENKVEILFYRTNLDFCKFENFIAFCVVGIHNF